MPASSSSTSAVAMTARLTRPARMQHAVETPAGDSGAASSSAQNRGRGSAPVFIVLQLIAAVDVATPNSLSLCCCLCSTLSLGFSVVVFLLLVAPVLLQIFRPSFAESESFRR